MAPKEQVDGPMFNLGRSEGVSDVAVALRKILDPEDTEKLNLSASLQRVKDLVERTQEPQRPSSGFRDVGGTVIVPGDYFVASRADGNVHTIRFGRILTVSPRLKGVMWLSMPGVLNKPENILVVPRQMVPAGALKLIDAGYQKYGGFSDT